MIQMHHRVIEDVSQWPPGNPNVSMIQMPDHNGDKMNDISLFRLKATQYHHSKHLQGFVQYILHPMVPEVGRKTHFLDRMMHLMKLP